MTLPNNHNQCGKHALYNWHSTICMLSLKCYYLTIMSSDKQSLYFNIQQYKCIVMTMSIINNAMLIRFQQGVKLSNNKID